MTASSIAFLSADVLELTGVSESYLSFLVRAGVVDPIKHRNGKTNLFSPEDVERVRWAASQRGQLSVPEIRQRVRAGAL